MPRRKLTRPVVELFSDGEILDVNALHRNGAFQRPTHYPFRRLKTFPDRIVTAAKLASLSLGAFGIKLLRCCKLVSMKNIEDSGESLRNAATLFELPSFVTYRGALQVQAKNAR